jgi:hypothetical protein
VVDFVDADGGEADGGGDFVAEDGGGGVAGVRWVWKLAWKEKQVKPRESWIRWIGKCRVLSKRMASWYERNWSLGQTKIEMKTYYRRTSSG